MKTRVPRVYPCRKGRLRKDEAREVVHPVRVRPLPGATFPACCGPHLRNASIYPSTKKKSWNIGISPCIYIYTIIFIWVINHLLSGIHIHIRGLVIQRQLIFRHPIPCRLQPVEKNNKHVANVIKHVSMDWQ